MKLKIKTNFDLFYRKKNFEYNKIIDNFLKNLDKKKILMIVFIITLIKTI